MAPHPDFPALPYAILDPTMRWFPADEALRETSMDKLVPPLVAQLRRKVKELLPTRATAKVRPYLLKRYD